MYKSDAKQTKATNVAVIVRSAYERTEELCTHLVKQQVLSNNVVVIHERPFSKAVQRAFEIGLDYNLDWTLCVDADSLLGKDAISTLVTAAETLAQKEHVFCAQGEILDRLLNVFRFGGVHLYQTRYLHEAIDNTEITAKVIRPETHIKEQMEHRGFRVGILPLRIALHDYFQYYKDIFRKSIVHSHKHDDIIYSEIWRFLSSFDADFRIALEGWKASKTFQPEQIVIDVGAYPDNIDQILHQYGLIEKEKLSLGDFSFDIDLYLQEGSPELHAWQQCELRLIRRLRRKHRRLGTAQFVLWFLYAVTWKETIGKLVNGRETEI